MTSWQDWILDRNDYIQKQQPEKPVYYTAAYKNREVKAHTVRDCIIIEWYMDGVKLQNPLLPYEHEREIVEYTSQLIGTYASAGRMMQLVHFLEKYLPYLKDRNSSGAFKYITINCTLDLGGTKDE